MRTDDKSQIEDCVLQNPPDVDSHDWNLTKLQVLTGKNPPLAICAAHTNGPPDMLFTLAYTYTERDEDALLELVALAKLGLECRAAATEPAGGVE